MDKKSKILLLWVFQNWDCLWFIILTMTVFPFVKWQIDSLMHANDGDITSCNIKIQQNIHFNYIQNFGSYHSTYFQSILRQHQITESVSIHPFISSIHVPKDIRQYICKHKQQVFRKYMNHNLAQIIPKFEQQKICCTTNKHTSIDVI